MSKVKPGSSFHSTATTILRTADVDFCELHLRLAYASGEAAGLQKAFGILNERMQNARNNTIDTSNDFSI